MSTDTVARNDAAPTITDPRRRRLVMAAVCAALVAVVAGVSGLNVAQQAIALDLGASQSQILWAINGYTVALAALLMPVGAIGDRWGRKPVLLIGLGVFALGSLVAAFAATPELLIVGRVVAGAGAAMVMPVTLSVITSSFPEEARGSAVGVWAGFAGAGGVIGLLASAIIIDDLTWPWLFAIPVGMAAVAGLLAAAVVPNSHERGEGRFDTAGSILAVLAVGGIVLGIHEGPERGWSDALTIAGLVVGVGGLAGFVIRELRTAHPLLDVRVFANRALSSGIVALTVVFGIMFGIFLTLMQFMQAVLGFSAVRGAVGLLPMALVMIGLSPFAPKAAQRVGLRTMLVAGALLVGTGLVVMAVMVDTASYWSVVPGLLLTALGLAATMTPATTAITGSLARGSRAWPPPSTTPPARSAVRSASRSWARSSTPSTAPRSATWRARSTPRRASWSRTGSPAPRRSRRAWAARGPRSSPPPARPWSTPGRARCGWARPSPSAPQPSWSSCRSAGRAGRTWPPTACWATTPRAPRTRPPRRAARTSPLSSLRWRPSAPPPTTVGRTPSSPPHDPRRMIEAMAVIPLTAIASARRVQAGGGGISKPETITALVSAAASRSGFASW